MAIRFVDKEPDGRAGKTEAPKREAAVRPGVDGPAPVPPAMVESGALDDGIPPGLPHAKPEPKPRGRRTPAAAAGKPPDAGSEEGPPPVDGLLPGFQVHAKPTPKPRGRKKAFG